MAVLVGVTDGVRVPVGVRVGVRVREGVGVAVGVRVMVVVRVTVGVGVLVGVGVMVRVGVRVGVVEGVPVTGPEGVGVGSPWKTNRTASAPSDRLATLADSSCVRFVSSMYSPPAPVKLYLPI